MGRFGRNAELPAGGPDLGPGTKVRRGQEHGIGEGFQGIQSRPVAVPRKGIFAIGKAGVAVSRILGCLSIAAGEQTLPPVAECHALVAVQSAFGSGIGRAVDDIATKRLQEGREGIGVPFAGPGHPKIKRIFELARCLGRIERRLKLFTRPGFRQRRGAQFQLIQIGLARDQRHGGIPQTDGIELATPDALGAGQEVGDLGFVDLQGLHIARPCPVRHDRPVNIQDVGQIARQRTGDDRIVIGTLREALQFHHPVGLAGVEIADDLVDDLGLNLIAGAVVPHGQRRLCAGGAAKQNRGNAGPGEQFRKFH